MELQQPSCNNKARYIRTQYSESCIGGTQLKRGVLFSWAHSSVQEIEINGAIAIHYELPRRSAGRGTLGKEFQRMIQSM